MSKFIAKRKWGMRVLVFLLCYGMVFHPVQQKAEAHSLLVPIVVVLAGGFIIGAATQGAAYLVYCHTHGLEVDQSVLSEKMFEGACIGFASALLFVIGTLGAPFVGPLVAFLAVFFGIHLMAIDVLSIANTMQNGPEGDPLRDPIENAAATAVAAIKLGKRITFNGLVSILKSKTSQSQIEAAITQILQAMEDSGAFLPDTVASPFAGVYADISTASIYCEGMSVETSGASYSDGQHAWALTNPGSSYIEASFDISTVPESVILSLCHRASSTLTGGYGSIDIFINGELYKNNYNIGEYHQRDGKPSTIFEADEWEISNASGYLRMGQNTITIKLDSAANPDYAIAFLSVKTGKLDLYPAEILGGWLEQDCAKPGDIVTLSCQIKNINDSSVESWLGATIRHHSTGYWSSDQSHDKPQILQPGTHIYSREFLIHEDTPSGLYDVEFGVHSGWEIGEGETWDTIWQNAAITINEISWIEISGPRQVNEGSSANYTCVATYSDGSTADITDAASWSENSAYASISNGNLTTSGISSDQSCRITATYRGFSDTLDVMIKNLSGRRVEIKAFTPIWVSNGTITGLWCTFYDGQGSSQDVTTLTSWSEDSPYAHFSTAPMAPWQFVIEDLPSDQVITIIAQYEELTDSFLMEAKDERLLRVEISGPTELPERSSASYSCKAFYRSRPDVGRTKTNSCSWSEDSIYASISQGVFSTSEVPSSQQCQIRAEYEGIADTFDMRIKDVPVSFLVISGPNEVDHDLSADYTCTAHFADGISMDVTRVASWFTDCSNASIFEGHLITFMVGADTLCNVIAIYQGNAGEKELTIRGPHISSISKDKTSIDFGSTSTTKNFQVWNDGTGILSYNVSVTSGRSYFSVTPPSGSSIGSLDRKSHTVTVNRDNITPGQSVSGMITISSSEADDSPQYINLSASRPVQPVIAVTSPNGDENWYVGETYNIIWNASGITGNVDIHYSIDSGMAYHFVATVPATDGSYAWTIPDVNSTHCRVQVQEEGGGVSDESDGDFTIVRTNRPPLLASIGDKSVNENSTLIFDVNATDPDGDPLIYSAQNLPSGATFSSQIFAWTPSYNQAGSYQVTFRASDGHDQDSETITITINNVNRPPVLGAIANQSVDENSLLSFSVSATDPDGQALTYSVSGLPAGAVFASQTLTWTPSYDQAGTYSVTFTADDGQAQDSQAITITVINVNRTPVLTAIDNKSVYADDPLTFTIDATDPDGDTLTYSAGTLPSGATFTSQDFDWTPSQGQMGSYDVTFIASDGQLQDSETITITVNNINPSPILGGNR